MSNWQAILFDLDDTLYPEWDYVLSGFGAVARWAQTRLSVPSQQIYDELTHLYKAGVRGNTFDRWLEERDLLAEGVVADMVNTYREHTPKIKPFPSVPSLLVRLKRRYKLGLISDGYWEVQQRKLDALGIASFFDAVVFSDTLGRHAWKPSVEPFQKIVKDLAIQATRAVYVADNPLKDFLGARKTGMRTIWYQGANGEYTRYEPPTTDHAAHAIIEHLSDIEQVLDTME